MVLCMQMTRIFASTFANIADLSRFSSFARATRLSQFVVKIRSKETWQGDTVWQRLLHCNISYYPNASWHIMCLMNVDFRNTSHFIQLDLTTSSYVSLCTEKREVIHHLKNIFPVHILTFEQSRSPWQHDVAIEGSPQIHVRFLNSIEQHLKYCCRDLKTSNIISLISVRQSVNQLFYLLSWLWNRNLWIKRFKTCLKAYWYTPCLVTNSHKVKLKKNTL